MKREEAVKLFGLNNLVIESSLKEIQRNFQIDLGKGESENSDQSYLPQIPEDIRFQADKMSYYYKILFCIERYIRNIIIAKLLEVSGPNWWEIKIPQEIRDNVNNLKQKEEEQGFTPRSEEAIDYVTLGEYSKIINSNWDEFGDIFRNQKGINRVLKDLNFLRNPIAHCCLISETEVDRLHLTLKDFFMQME